MKNLVLIISAFLLMASSVYSADTKPLSEIYIGLSISMVEAKTWAGRQPGKPYFQGYGFLGIPVRVDESKFVRQAFADVDQTMEDFGNFVGSNPAAELSDLFVKISSDVKALMPLVGVKADTRYVEYVIGRLDADMMTLENLVRSGNY